MENKEIEIKDNRIRELEKENKRLKREKSKVRFKKEENKTRDSGQSIMTTDSTTHDTLVSDEFNIDSILKEASNVVNMKNSTADEESSKKNPDIVEIHHEQTEKEPDQKENKNPRRKPKKEKKKPKRKATKSKSRKKSNKKNNKNKESSIDIDALAEIHQNMGEIIEDINGKKRKNGRRKGGRLPKKA